MSRVAKKPIILPETVKFQQNQDCYLISGKNGSLNVPLFPDLTVAINDNVLSLVKDANYLNNSRTAGLLRSLLDNAIQGVTIGFTKVLILKGLGFRCNIDKNILIMSLGYSHKVHYDIPENINISVEKDTIITITGSDKQQVGQIAAEIRSKKIPDNYHGKGILYQDEIILLKEGKKK